MTPFTTTGVTSSRFELLEWNTHCARNCPTLLRLICASRLKRRPVKSPL